MRGDLRVAAVHPGGRAGVGSGVSSGCPPQVNKSWRGTSSGASTWNAVEEIGRGTFGVVYKVEDASGRVGALKELCLSDFSEKRRGHIGRRFRHESAVFQHVNNRCAGVPRCLDREQDGDPPWIVLEFVGDLDLNVLLDELRDSGFEGGRALRVLSYLMRVCNALRGLHGLGVVHRDVKPGNIRCHSSGEDAWLVDLGAAIFGGRRPPEDRLTRQGQPGPLTPAYAAPEQIEKPDTVGTPADIYSIGVILDEMNQCVPKDFAGPWRDDLVALIEECRVGVASDRPTARDCERRLRAITKSLEQQLNNSSEDVFEDLTIELEAPLREVHGLGDRSSAKMDESLLDSSPSAPGLMGKEARPLYSLILAACLMGLSVLLLVGVGLVLGSHWSDLGPREVSGATESGADLAPDLSSDRLQHEEAVPDFGNKPPGLDRAGLEGSRGGSLKDPSWEVKPRDSDDFASGSSSRRPRGDSPRIQVGGVGGTSRAKSAGSGDPGRESVANAIRANDPKQVAEGLDSIAKRVLHAEGRERREFTQEVVGGLRSRADAGLQLPMLGPETQEVLLKSAQEDYQEAGCAESADLGIWLTPPGSSREVRKVLVEMCVKCKSSEEEAKLLRETDPARCASRGGTWRRKVGKCLGPSLNKIMVDGVDCQW